LSRRAAVGVTGERSHPSALKKVLLLGSPSVGGCWAAVIVSVEVLNEGEKETSISEMSRRYEEGNEEVHGLCEVSAFTGTV